MNLPPCPTDSMSASARSQYRARELNQTRSTSPWSKRVLGDRPQHRRAARRRRARQIRHSIDQSSPSDSHRLWKGFTTTNLKNMRSFYLAFPIGQTLSDQLSWSHYCQLIKIKDARPVPSTRTNAPNRLGACASCRTDIHPLLRAAAVRRKRCSLAAELMT